MSILNQEDDVRLKFARHIKNNDIKVSGVAKKIERSPAHLGQILKGQRPLTDDLLKALNSVLGTNFTRSKTSNHLTEQPLNAGPGSMQRAS